MINYTNLIANKIAKITNVDENELMEYIEVPPKPEMGDYAFPCFKLAKVLKKSPVVIATEILNQLEKNEYIERIEQQAGYLNFYINKEKLVKTVLEEINEKQDNYGNDNWGQTIVIDYSSPNIAKPFHIGHLRTTLIGNSLHKIYSFLGCNVIGVNHLGDYGTQFGKMIEAYKMWSDEYDLEEDSINKMMDMYVRINALCKEDEAVLERCRENFRLLEEGDEYCVKLWQKFKDLSLAEFDKIYKILDVQFESMNGEAFYSDKIPEVVQLLEEKGVITESEGARVVDLTDEGIDTPCIIQKTNGSSIYATRDLAAILYRARTYDFDKCLYVVAYEQNLHFKQVFAVAKYLVDEKYVKGLKHVSYGMVSLPTGKMSTRLGNVVKIEDLINETINKAKEIIAEKNPDLEDKDDVATKVGIAAIVFNTLSTTTNKDQVFDWNTALNFQGETGPYIQYTYVRTNSILENLDYEPKIEDVDFSVLTDEASINVIKTLYSFNEILESSAEKNEPAILSRYLIELSQNYSNFYNENRIMIDDKKLKCARAYLTACVGRVLKIGAGLLGIKMPNKM